ncbi:hypothetical protein CEUSTIGMA_g2716.t1 [Chlamydomonas eustigma]|uniref:Uncharacterized protein n=1 Tax=Chlamydomonas eustigma TaxID=1157962 RepID=A0A250WWS7_9CHLO|nr:hypothetical protein CEUSTIGMA_g2716.t1 [Chlamydomonas eustigma]|eukprot:GAX75271.1 hypothetical protein CEUSTIGMA_g2716.t1 [Chlamydomonas eustigma]
MCRTALPPTSPMLMRQVLESPSLYKWRQMADSLGLSLSPPAAAAGAETRGHNQLEPSAVHSSHHINSSVLSSQQLGLPSAAPLRGGGINSSVLSSQQLGLPSAAPLRGGGINSSVQPEHQSYSFDREGDSAGNIRDAARHIATELDQALAELLTNMEGGRNHPHLLPNPEHHSFAEGLGSPTRHSNATRFLRSCRPCNTQPSLPSSLLPSLQNSQTTTIMPTAAMSSPLPPPRQPYYDHPASSQPPASYQLQLPPPPYASNAASQNHNQGPANYNYNPSSPSRQGPPPLMMMPQGSVGPSHHCHCCCHHHYEGKVKAVQALPSTAHNQCLSTCCSLASNTMAANPGSVPCATAAGTACTVAHPLYPNWPGLGACPGEGMPTLHTTLQTACHPTCCKATGPCLQSAPRAGPPSISGTATVQSPQHQASILLVFPPQQQQQERPLSDQHPAAAASVLPNVAPGQSASPSGFNCSNSTDPAATTAAVRGDAGGGQRRSVGLHDAFMAAAVAGGEQGDVVQPAVLRKPVQQPEMAAPMIMSPAPPPADALFTADRMVSEEVESVVSQDDKQEVRLSGTEELRGSQPVTGELQNRSSRGIAIAAELGTRSESHIDILTLPGRPYTTIDMLLTGSSAGVEAGTAAATAVIAVESEVETGAAESMSKSIVRREADLNGQDALRIPSGESAAAPPGSAAAAASGVGDERMLLMQAAAAAPPDSAAAASGVGDERMLLMQAAAHQEGPVQQLAGGMPASTRAPAKAASPEFATSISYSGTDVAAAAASRQVSTGGSHLPYYHETVVPTPQNQTVSSVDMSGGISWQQQQAAPGMYTSVQQQQPWPPAVTMSWVPHAPGTARHQQQLIDMPYPHPNQTSAYLPGTAPVPSRQLHSSSLPASIQPAGSLQHQPGFVRGMSQDTYSPSPVSLMHQQYIAAPASSSRQQYILPPFPSSQMPYMSQESSSSSQKYMPSHPSTFNPKPSTVHAGSHSSLPPALTTTTTYSSSSTRGSMAHQPNPPPTRHHNPADDTNIINASSTQPSWGSSAAALLHSQGGTQPSSTQTSWGSSAAALLHSRGGAGQHIHCASSSQSNKPAVNPDYATRYHASTHQHTTAGYAYPSHSIPSSSSLSNKTLSHPQLLPSQHHAGSLSQSLIHPNYYQPHLLHAPPHSYPSSYEQPQQSRSDGSNDGLVVAATRAVQLISEVGLGSSSSSRDSSLAGTTMNNTGGSQQHQAQRHPNRGASSSAQFPGSAPQYQQDLQLSQRGEVLSGYKGQSSAPPVHHQSYQPLHETPHFSHTSTAAVHQQYHDTLSAQMRAVYGPSYRPV